MFLLVGLGNPGDRYRNTPHNMGFDILDAWVALLGLTWERDARRQALVTTFKSSGVPWVFIKPQAYMNCSGAPVQSLLQYYKGSPAQVVVVHDDIDLALMEVKIRLSGGAGGHNGVRDLIAHLGPDFIRYRVGIGPRPEGPEASESLADYVLRPFSAEQKALKEEKMPKIIQGLQLLVDKGPDSAMNRVHSL